MKYASIGGKPLRFVLWITQLLLAFVFGMAGWLKATYPPETLALYVPWSETAPLWLVRFIGGAELLGAFGVVLPALTRIKPFLTPLAALLLGVAMALAAVFHIVRGETVAVVMPFLLALLALFVAWGRARRAPIPPR